MESFEGFRKSSTFIVAAGTEVQGDLILNGANTTLDLYANDFFSPTRSRTAALPERSMTERRSR